MKPAKASGRALAEVLSRRGAGAAGGRWGHGLAVVLLAAAGACTEPKTANPLVMPAREAAPSQLAPVAKVEVDDSEDARLVGQGAPELLGAVEAYRAGHAQAALARFFEVMRDPLRPSTPKHLAEIYAAKALLELELPHASWMLFDRIAKRSHPLRLNALPWLGLLAGRIDTDAVLESLVHYTPSERDALTTQSKPLLERLAYLFGRQAFLKGDDAGAGALLGEVTAASSDYPRALFMLGVIDVRAKRADAALDTFDAVTGAVARAGIEEPERIRAMATMAQARVMYELAADDPNKLELALSAYRKARGLEDVAEDAKVESLWVLLKLGRVDEALTELSAIRPTLTARHAEVDQLEVLLHVEKCALDPAETLLSAATVRHKDVAARIAKVLAADGDAGVDRAVALGIGGAKPASPDDEVVVIATRRARLARILRRFGAIREEVQRAAALPLDFRESLAGKQVQALVDAAVLRTRQEVGTHLSAELAELEEITATHLASFDKLEAEIALRRKEGCN